MSMTLMMAKMTCQTMQRTGATLVVWTESLVTWCIAWSRTPCVHSWQLIALSAMRTYARTSQSVSTQSAPLSSDANRRVNMACMWRRSCTASDQNQSWRTRNDGSTSSWQRGIRRAGPVDGRATGLVIKFAQSFVWKSISTWQLDEAVERQLE